MKECGSLEIVTGSIKSFLLDVFDKDIQDILISDLLLVETLTIDGYDLDGNKQIISFQDLKNFKNLKYLEVANTFINSSVINILSHLLYLENIVFRNCSFSKKIKNMNKLYALRSLRIINCLDFDPLFISEIKTIKRLYLAGLSINDFTVFHQLDLDSLDISYSKVQSVSGIGKVNIKNLVISHIQYKRFCDDLDRLSFKIMIMADFEEGYYIEKWLH